METEISGRLLITGDLHGDTAALTMITRQLREGDALFVAGDFGFVFWDNRDGNHENHRALNKFPVEQWNNARVHMIRSRIIHVLRGEVLCLKGKRIFCFGGAFSIDRAYRTLNKSYWEEEIPSEEDYENGNKNLKACDYKVDYVITHTCPLNLIPSLGGYHSAMEERQLQNYLQYVSETVYDSLTRWYFGHWHRDQEFGEKFRVVYLDLVDMETGKKIW